MSSPKRNSTLPAAVPLERAAEGVRRTPSGTDVVVPIQAFLEPMRADIIRELRAHFEQRLMEERRYFERRLAEITKGAARPAKIAEDDVKEGDEYLCKVSREWRRVKVVTIWSANRPGEPKHFDIVDPETGRSLQGKRVASDFRPLDFSPEPGSGLIRREGVDGE
jgi:hypothetical protein